MKRSPDSRIKVWLLSIGVGGLVAAGVAALPAVFGEVAFFHYGIMGAIAGFVAVLLIGSQLSAAYTEIRQARSEAQLIPKIGRLVLKSNEALPIGLVLAEICRSTGWDCAEAWTPLPDGSALVRRLEDYSGSPPRKTFSGPAQPLRIPPNRDIPGRVWSGKTPVWVKNIDVLPEPDFPLAYRSHEGLRTAVGIPVMAGDTVVAVLMFYREKETAEDEPFLETVVLAANELGDAFQTKSREADGLRLSSYLDYLEDAIVVSDVWLRITYWNKSAEKLYGWPSGEVLGKTVQQVLKTEFSGVGSDDALLKVIEMGCYSGEAVQRRKDGTSVSVAARTTVISGPHGEIKGFMNVFSDISRKRAVEEEIHSNERRWKVWLESMRLPVVGLSPQGQVEYVNPYFIELTGYSIDEIIGRNWIDSFVPESFRAEVRKVLKNVLDGRSFEAHRHPVRVKSGKEREVTWFHSRLRDPSGVVLGTQSIGECLPVESSAPGR